MLLTVVVALHGLCHACIVREVTCRCIVELVAVVVVVHEGVHVSVIVTQIQRRGTAVVVRPVVPVPG